MIKAGELDRRITIERGVDTLDSFGGVDRSWSAIATVWAKVTPISDGERWRAQEVAAEVTTRFLIRWGAGVLPTDRIRYAGAVYEISGVKEVGRREGQEITAAARAE